MIGTRVSLPKSKQRVSSFNHPSIHQLSTLEKTKFCQHRILSSVLSASFQQIAGGGALARDLCHGQQRVSPFYRISHLAYSEDFDFHNSSSPGCLMAKMTELKGALAIRLIIGLDFAETLLHQILCAFFWYQFRTNCRTEILLDKYKRWFHSSRVKFPLVNMSASWLLVSVYLYWFWGPNWFDRIQIKGISVGSGDMSHCRTSAFNNHLDYSFIVLKHILESFLTRGWTLEGTESMSFITSIFLWD